MSQREEKPINTPKPSELCLHCKQMYGYPLFDDLCSICFKNQTRNIQIKIETPVPSTAPPPVIPTAIDMAPKRPASENQKEPPAKGKCGECGKKTGLLGFVCNHCSGQHCRMHRLPEEHSCCVDFITLGKKKLKMDNPIISKKKVQEIE